MQSRFFMKPYSAGASLSQQRTAGSTSEDSGSEMFLDAFEDLAQRGKFPNIKIILIDGIK